MAQIKENKILFVIPSLAGGGAERVLVLLLKYINRRRFKPVLVVFDNEKAYSEDFYWDVPIICLNKKTRFDFFRLIWTLSRLIRRERPALILSFINYTNYMTILAHGLANLKIPLFLNERINLTCSLVNQKFTKIKKFLVRWLYPKSTGIISLSGGVREDLIANYKIPKDRCFVIYNGLDIKQIKELASEELNSPWFKEDIPVVVSCGRLTAQKNYPLLLKAMNLVLKKGVNFRLLILGKGEDHSKLEKLAKDIGVSGNLIFLGFQNNPFKYISRAAVFVLSSSWEGFGNVIVEAMACGVPVISTRCPSGPDEIISDGLNGLLVPPGDVNALAKAILRLLKDELLRKRLAEAGVKRAEDFRIEKMVSRYEKCFERAIKDNSMLL
jgi:glycosyltransferase involved in cell wall biosynthesis